MFMTETEIQLKTELTFLYILMLAQGLELRSPSVLNLLNSYYVQARGMLRGKAISVQGLTTHSGGFQRPAITTRLKTPFRTVQWAYASTRAKTNTQPQSVLHGAALALAMHNTLIVSILLCSFL